MSCGPEINDCLATIAMQLAAPDPWVIVGVIVSAVAALASVSVGVIALLVSSRANRTAERSYEIAERAYKAERERSASEERARARDDLYDWLSNISGGGGSQEWHRLSRRLRSKFLAATSSELTELMIFAENVYSELGAFPIAYQEKFWPEFAAEFERLLASWAEFPEDATDEIWYLIDQGTEKWTSLPAEATPNE